MRAPKIDKNGMKKGAWSEEEDSKLRDYILRYGHWNWRLLPKYAGLARCGKSCRLRWVNYLRPGVKLGNYTKEEEDLIAKLHDQLGNKWSAIAAKLPGRSDNEVKNYWHTHLKKRRPKRIPSPNSSCKNSLEASSSAEKLESSSNVPILDSDPGNRGPVSWDSDDSASSSRSADQEIQTSFLSELEPVLAETCYSPNRDFQNYLSDERASSSDSVDGFEESFWSKPFEVDTSYSQDAAFAPFGEDIFFSSFLFT